MHVIGKHNIFGFVFFSRSDKASNGEGNDNSKRDPLQPFEYFFLFPDPVYTDQGYTHISNFDQDTRGRKVYRIIKY